MIDATLLLPNLSIYYLSNSFLITLAQIWRKSEKKVQSR